jgi:hypothetical protein
MIYIVRDTPTEVVLTLSQAKTINDPYYLIKVQSNFNSGFTPIYEVLTLSVETERYDQFTLNLDIPKGEYTYLVYECVDPNPVDEDDATSMIETGLMIVDANDDVDTDVYL